MILELSFKCDKGEELYNYFISVYSLDTCILDYLIVYQKLWKYFYA